MLATGIALTALLAGCSGGFSNPFAKKDEQDYISLGPRRAPVNNPGGVGGMGQAPAGQSALAMAPVEDPMMQEAEASNADFFAMNNPDIQVPQAMPPAPAGVPGGAPGLPSAEGRRAPAENIAAVSGPAMEDPFATAEMSAPAMPVTTTGDTGEYPDLGATPPAPQTASPASNDARMQELMRLQAESAQGRSAVEAQASAEMSAPIEGGNAPLPMPSEADIYYPNQSASSAPLPELPAATPSNQLDAAAVPASDLPPLAEAPSPMPAPMPSYEPVAPQSAGATPAAVQPSPIVAPPPANRVDVPTPIEMPMPSTNIPAPQSSAASNQPMDIGMPPPVEGSSEYPSYAAGGSGPMLTPPRGGAAAVPTLHRSRYADRRLPPSGPVHTRSYRD
jgi:hypothetical protein